MNRKFAVLVREGGEVKRIIECQSLKEAYALYLKDITNHILIKIIGDVNITEKE